MGFFNFKQNKIMVTVKNEKVLNGCSIKQVIKQPVGFLIHEQTYTQISVYSKINPIHRYFIRLFFGIKYKSNKKS